MEDVVEFVVVVGPKADGVIRPVGTVLLGKRPAIGKENAR